MNYKLSAISVAVFVIALFLIMSAEGASKIKGSVAYWRFNEGKGNAVMDSSGTKNRKEVLSSNTGALIAGPGGTITSAEQMWAKTDKNESVLKLDGTDDYVLVDDAPGINIPDDGLVTICAWINPGNFGTEMAIVIKGNRSQNGYGVFLAADGRINAGRCGGGNFNSEATLKTGQWCYIVSVMGSKNRKVNGKIYIDGVLDKDSGSSLPVVKATSAKLKIGASSMDDDATFRGFFDGFIDDVKIYNYALTDKQIMAEYKAGMAAYQNASASKER